MSVAETRVSQQLTKRRTASTDTAEQRATRKAQLEKRFNIIRLKENLRLIMEEDENHRIATEKIEAILRQIKDQEYQEKRRIAKQADEERSEALATQKKT